MEPDWDAAFEEMLREIVEPSHHHLLTPTAELTALGVDSIAAMQLLTMLEEGYQIIFPPEAFTAATFATPELLWGTVVRLRSGSPE